MRDPKRDQESQERYIHLGDEDLILLIKSMNRTLLDVLLDRVKYNEETQMQRSHALATEIESLRYEASRRRIPNPNGAVNVNVGPVKQVNADTTITAGTQAGGSITGLNVGTLGD